MVSAAELLAVPLVADLTPDQLDLVARSVEDVTLLPGELYGEVPVTGVCRARRLRRARQRGRLPGWRLGGGPGGGSGDDPGRRFGRRLR